MNANLPDNPLVQRYAGAEMVAVWSPQRRYSTWRRLWVALAEAERALGLEITAEQVEALRAAIGSIDFEAVAALEKRFRHDVMAHIHAFGDCAPEARGIIHLGATSCYVTDNADVLLLREALTLVRDKLVRVIDSMAKFAQQWKAEPCLGYTHYQPAQLVTVGKRATLWTYELVQDLTEVQRRLDDLLPLGVKGATGTQASFLKLFEGDANRVETLDRLVLESFGFTESVPVSGQTYSRKVDARILETLGGLGVTAHRLGSDLRLLAHDREVEEPFENEQVGSSAMPYKRNPMRAERLCSLGRFLSALPVTLAQTAANQWFERTLDDSAIRRLTIPQAFLAADAILALMQNLAGGLVVNRDVIRRRVESELPAMASENLLMAAVDAGGDRQAIHERIRVHAFAAAAEVKAGRANDLIDRLAEDEAFAQIDLRAELDPSRFIGLAPQQVERFLAQVIEPLRTQYAAILDHFVADEIRV